MTRNLLWFVCLMLVCSACSDLLAVRAEEKVRESPDATSTLRLWGPAAQMYEEIAVEHVIRNNSKGNVGVIQQWLAGTDITVLDSRGEVVPPSRYGVEDRKFHELRGSLSTTSIPPGEEKAFRIDLQELFDFSLSGKYRVTLKTRVHGKSTPKDESDYRVDSLELDVGDRTPFYQRVSDKVRIAKLEEAATNAGMARLDDQRIRWALPARRADDMVDAKAVLSLRSAKIVQDEPVTVQFALENTSKGDLQVSYHPDLVIWQICVSYFPAPDKQLPVQRTDHVLDSKDRITPATSQATVIVPAGKTWTKSLCASRYLDLSRPGKYKISVGFKAKGLSTPENKSDYIGAAAEFEIQPAVAE